jgi:hypothetical protein
MNDEITVRMIRRLQEAFEEGSESMSKEANSQLAIRQEIYS